MTKQETKKYKVICKVNNPSWIPSLEEWKEKLIIGEVYRVFAMNNGFQIIVEGRFINEIGQVKKLKRTFSKSFCKSNFKYI